MAVLCIVLGMACVYDYRTGRIPNYLVVLMSVFGAGYCIQSGGLTEMLCCFGKAVLVMLLLFPFFKIGTVGAGDIKLLGVTAGILPFEKILMFLFISLLIAAVISLLKMWKSGQFMRRLRYLWKYLSDVVQGGRWLLYPETEDRKSSGICLSGPVLLSLLLYLGGIY